MKARWISRGMIGVILGVGVVIPLLAVLLKGDGSNWNDPVLFLVAQITLKQAAISTVLAALIGLGLGVWIGPDPVSLKLLSVSYVIPTVVIAQAAVRLLGHSGLGILYSLSAVIVVHVFLNSSYVAMQVGRALSSLPADQSDAVRTLGAGWVSRFRFVLWPYLRGAWFIASAHVFGLCIMSFAIVLLLGGGPPVDTLETAIYGKLRLGGLDLGSARSYALISLGLTLLPWLLITGKARVAPLPVGESHLSINKLRKLQNFKRGVAALTFLPFFAVLLGVRWGLLFNSEIRQQLISAGWVSLQIACVAAILTVGVALLGIHALGRPRSRWIEIAMSFPAGISALVLGLGVWLAYGRWIDPFESGFILLAGVQSVLFLPLAFRAFLPLLDHQAEVRLEAARTLGASQIQAFWWIEGRRWRTALVSVALMIAGSSLGELAVISLFSGRTSAPLPLLLSQWMSRYQFEEAGLLAALLLLFSTAMVLGGSAALDRRAHV